MTLAVRLSQFRGSIQHIVSMRADKKVIRIYTKPIITFMKHMLLFIPNVKAKKERGNCPMRINLSFLNAKAITKRASAVAPNAFTSRPNPASIPVANTNSGENSGLKIFQTLGLQRLFDTTAGLGRAVQKTSLKYGSLCSAFTLAQPEFVAILIRSSKLKQNCPTAKFLI